MRQHGLRGSVRVVAAFLAATASLAAPASAVEESAARAEADWILSLQVFSGPDGGLIPLNLPAELCIPYFSNMAASGLAAARYATGDARYSDAAWRWLQWYAAHMDATGFVTDYEYRDPDGNGKRWVSTGTYDSTDAYAATFLVAVRDFFVATRDATRLQTIWPAVRKAVSAIQATAAPDWLTYAKPGFKQKYLMDNVEVFEGWRSVAMLATAGVDDPALRSVAEQWVAQMPAALERFWNASRGGYDVAISDTGFHDAVDWAELYPSATGQAWMINSGLVPPDRALDLLALIEQTHAAWDSPFATDLFDRPNGRGTEQVKWWPEIADAFARSGLNERADLGLGRMLGAATSSSRRWPYHAGNAGRIIALTLAEPATTLTSTPPAATTSGAASFSFTGVAGPSQGTLTFECSLDGAAFGSCVSPRSYGGLAEGVHRFEVRARDGIGRVDTSPAAWTWAVDVTAPVVSLTGLPADPSNAWPSTFVFDVSDNLSAPAAECSLDGAPFAPCVSPKPYAGLPTGTHSFAAHARDPAGNLSAARAYTWFVDGIAPSTRISSGPPPVVEGGTVVISFDATDDVAGGLAFECRFDYQTFKPCASPMSYDTVNEAAHRFEVRARDAAGNWDPTPEVRSWVVDHSPPQTWLLSGPPPFAGARGAAFLFAGLDTVGAKAFECSVDGAAFSSCSSPLALHGFADGPHAFEVRALDGAAIADPTPARHVWIVDTATPRTSITTPNGAILSDVTELGRTVTGTVTDTWAGIVEVRVTFTASPSSGPPVVVKALMSCEDATARSCTWTAQPPKNPARYTVTAYAIDRASNVEKAAASVTVLAV